MFLTAVFRLRADNHDAARLRVSLRRWHAWFAESMEALCRRRGVLRREGIVPWTSKDGKVSRLVVADAVVHVHALACVPPGPHLHSSSRMALVVAVEEQVKSWLGLLADWENGGQKTPEPAFPSVKPGSAAQAVARWETALAASGSILDLPAERAWAAEVTRAQKARLLPQYFGSCMSGAAAEAHCGLLRREDGRYFALLTLFPQGDPLGEPVTRARNRRDRGAVRNVALAPALARWEQRLATLQAEGAPPEKVQAQARKIRTAQAFAPTERSRASVMCPLELEHGHEHLFFGRGVPKSAELVAKEDGFFLHVAFELPEPAARPAENLLTVKRGIHTLVAAVVTDPQGRELARLRVDGRDLARLVAEMDRVRALRQAAGKPTRGDRRVSRAAEHHLYSAGHQLIDLACRYQARILLLEDPGARQPTPFLRWKHFHRLAEVLVQLCNEAGLPPPQERKIYGAFRTCLRCGWRPGDPVRVEEPVADQCGACGTPRDAEYHGAQLLAWSELRLRLPLEGRPTLGEFVRAGRAGQ